MLIQVGCACSKPQTCGNFRGESDLDSDRTCRSIIASLIDMGIGNTPSKVKSSEVVIVGCKDPVFVKQIEAGAVVAYCKNPCRGRVTGGCSNICDFADANVSETIK